MSARARLFFLTVMLLTVPALSQAQVQWQPSTPPLVTAEHEPWFQAGDPIIWNGDYYYPAGPRQFFNQYQMLRSGSFRGIPLYTDATREPFSIVFVPVSGGLMQPYERRRSGALAGTSGSTAPSFPTDISGEGISTGTGGFAVDIAQNPGPPARARAYDVSPIEPTGTSGTGGTPGTSGTRTSGTSGTPGTAGTSSVVMTSIVPARELARAKRPGSRNTIWVDYEGRRWYANGVPVPVSSTEFVQRGTYYGFPVYARPGDPDTIYIPPSEGTLVTPFRLNPRH